ncbi:c-type cytochrome [Fulvivirga ulvae]|uniref:cytochrome-c peroxidase n=1 Tax=Fulvivirga ulvae TaxID=2904245 RepID=UPI001F284AE2|nr:cytochrome c peroxidase [Fulvivirga ulvae]UII32762.1 c-type cytochrome [Fulvivirga ulvae]
MFGSNKYAHLAICSVCICLFVSCEKDTDMTPDNTYAFTKPANFPEPTYTFDNNEVTKKGFELGRKLFFDPILSKDGSISCNNCHIQSTAFADSQQHPLSVGIDNRLGIRNAPSLANMAFYPDFFWDGGVNHLDFVPINAIESEFEMGETLSNVVQKLNDHDEYPGLFKEAFGTDKVTSPFMLQALSQFMLLMVSSNSPYDQYVRGEGISLSETELKGLELFNSKCTSCHSGELFTDFSYRNNGISGEFTDEGRGLITESSDDVGKFRVPSLRNVALTAPYMHNARFSTLQEVLDHYDEGIQQSSTLDPLLAEGISLNEQEKEQIIAFLKTLTDQEFRSDKRFQNN